MKVKRVSEDFKPIEINIVLETEDEAKKLYHLFNHLSLIDFMGFNENDARNAIGHEFHDSDYHIRFWDKVKELL